MFLQVKQYTLEYKVRYKPTEQDRKFTDPSTFEILEYNEDLKGNNGFVFIK